MKKIIIGLLLSTTIVSGAQAQDYGVRESTAWFGELIHKWETGNSSSSYKNKVRQEVTDASYNAQGIAGTGHHAGHGWCNEAVVWAMEQVDVFDQAQIDAGWHGTMRGRHWASVNNDNVLDNHSITMRHSIGLMFLLVLLHCSISNLIPIAGVALVSIMLVHSWE